MLVMLMPMMATAVEIDGISYNLDLNVKKAEVVYMRYSGIVIIPQTVTYEGINYSVTSIGMEAFYGCSVTSVTIPNSVETIGVGAFQSCSLTSITIPNSVTTIGGQAFKDCSLTSITIPNSVTTIGEGAFYDCTGLTSVTIPSSVTEIGNYAFTYCTGLTSVTIQNGVTSIGEGAFWGCTGLTSITIPNSVTTIGEFAIYQCQNLTTVNLGNGVTSIGENAFGGCVGLTSVTIPNSVTSIGLNAFAGCTGLTSVTIPNSVTYIGSGAFGECTGLTYFYCYAEQLRSSPGSGDGLYTETGAFNRANINYATLHVPEGCVDAYKAMEPWIKFKEIVAIKGEGETTEEETAGDEIKITSAGQTTWCSAYDLDFSDVEGLKAYTATGYHRTKGTIWLTRVKEVPAGEGILLIGDPGDYKVPHKSTTAYYANLMVGTVKAITLNETDGEYTNYYLSSGASGVGFYKVNGSVDIKANRAYLPLLKNTVSGTRGFIGMDFDDDDDGTTGIDIQSSIFNVQSKDVYYNLQGQRVDNPTKGLYIRNGKKVVIK